jgi:rhodanese-related sulfurtransferase
MLRTAMFKDARNKIATRLRALATLPVPELAPVRWTRRLAEELATRIEAEPPPAMPAVAPPRAGEQRAGKKFGAHAATVTAGVLRERIGARIPLQILDLREPGEIALGIIPGARVIRIDDLLVRLAEIRDAGVPVVLYCQNGSRSEYGGMHLLGSGIDAVETLEGGFEAWKASGATVAKAPTAIAHD